MKDAAAFLPGFSVNHLVALWLVPAGASLWSIAVYRKFGRAAAALLGFQHLRARAWPRRHDA